MACTQFIAVRPFSLAKLLLVLCIGIICSESWGGESTEISQLFRRLDSNSDNIISSAEIDSDQRWLFDRLLRIADNDQSGTLSEAEFQQGLEPKVAAKPILEKTTGKFPGADAAVVLLLKMDINRDGRVDAKEVPIELLDVFDQLAEQIDANDDDRLSQRELGRAGAKLSRQAQRIARQRQYDIPSELAKLRREQGDKADRFSTTPRPQQMLADSNYAAEFFAELDANGDGELKLAEIPEQLQPRLERLFRIADRNRDDALSKEEFLRGAERVSRFLKRFGKP